VVNTDIEIIIVEQLVPEAMKFCESRSGTFGAGNRVKRLTAWEEIWSRGIWLAN
jgi:hypothetical protein